MQFPDEDWESKWVYSEHPGKEFGKFVRTAGSFYNDGEADLGEYQCVRVYFVCVRASVNTCTSFNTYMIAYVYIVYAGIW